MMVDEPVCLRLHGDQLEQHAADHTKRKQGKPGKDPGRCFGKTADFRPLQTFEHTEPDQNGNAHQRQMERQRVDGVTEHSLEPGGRAVFFVMIDTDPLHFVPFFKSPDFFHIPFAERPVHQHHTDHDPDDHTAGSNRQPQRHAFFPVIGNKTFRHTAHSAVSALKPDLQQVPEHGGHIKEITEQEPGKTEPHHILSPRQDLPQTQLRQRDLHDLAQTGCHHPEEQRGKDHIDQKTRHFFHHIHPLNGDVTAETGDQHQPQQTADHGAGQVKPLEKRDRGTEQFAADQQQRERTENDYSSHFISLRFGVDPDIE